MGLDTSVIAMIEQIREMPADDPAPPLMTDDAARGAARLSDLLGVEEGPATGAINAAGPARGSNDNRGTLGDAILGQLDRIGEN
ncbi:MAG: hypothetical protein ACRYGK_03635 [Janthinobacterium lividum]